MILRELTDQVKIENIAGDQINPASNEKLEELKVILDLIDANTDTLEDKTQSIRNQLDVLMSTRASESTAQALVNAIGEESGTNLLNTLQNLEIIVASDPVLIEVRDYLEAIEIKVQTIIDKLDVNLSSRASESTLAEVRDTIGQESGKTVLSEFNILNNKDFSTEVTLNSVLSQLNIKISDLRDAIKGSGNKDFTTLEADIESILTQLDVALSSRASESTTQSVLNALGEGSGTTLLNELQAIIGRLGDVVETPTEYTVLDRLKDIVVTLEELLKPSITGALQIERFGSVLMEEGFINNTFDVINRWTETIVGGATRNVLLGCLRLDVTIANGNSITETFKQTNLVGTLGSYTKFSIATGFGDTLVTNHIREFGVKDFSGNNGIFYRLSNSIFYLVILNNGVETLHDISAYLPDSYCHIYEILALGAGQIIGVLDGTQIFSLSGTNVLVGDKIKIPFMKSYNIALLSQQPSPTNIQWLNLTDLSGTKFAITGKDDNGFVREVAVSATRRMLVSQEPPIPPPDTTSVKITEYGNVAGVDDYDYLIPNGETIHLQRFSAGAEPAGGSNVELWYDPDGTKLNMEIIDTIFSDGHSDQHDLNDEYIGDGTRRVVMRRTGLGSANARVVFGRWEGYY